MAVKKSPEVLVVGAGPVGLFTGLSLLARGVPVQVVDRDWRTGSHSYALALHGPSLEWLDELGVAAPLRQRGYRVHGIGLYDEARRRATLSIGGDAARPGLLVMPQAALERVLEEALQQRGVQVRWNHAVSRLVNQANHVTVTLDKLVKESLGYAVAHTEWMVAQSADWEVPFLIGADGHRSLVRRQLELEFPEVGPPQHFAVFEFRTDADLEHELRITLTDHTTNAVWPLPDGFCRWSFQLPDFRAPLAPRIKERVSVQIGPDQFPVLGEDQLRALLRERAPWFQGRIDEIRWQMVVRFERRLASSFGRQRTWLVGDAGHMTGPVGMQSMNVGFREAHALAGILAGNLGDGATAERLETYNQERLAEWRQLLGLASRPSAGPGTDPWIAGRADRLLSCLPASGPELTQLAQQLDVHV